MAARSLGGLPAKSVFFPMNEKMHPGGNVFMGGGGLSLLVPCTKH